MAGAPKQIAKIETAALTTLEEVVNGASIRVSNTLQCISFSSYSLASNKLQFSSYSCD